jgi:hypothetical protein
MKNHLKSNNKPKKSIFFIGLLERIIVEDLLEGQKSWNNLRIYQKMKKTSK